jgi:hypothetical protein
MSRIRIRTLLVALPLLVSGLLYAAWHSTGNRAAPQTEGYICPLTGEELPCRECCPLNG